jgi:gas vesicle protein
MVMKEELVTERREGIHAVSFLVGGLIGAGLALLLAPKAGKELRKDIEDIASSSRHSIETTIDKGKDLYEGSKAAVRSAFEAGKTAYTEELEKHRHAA